MESWIAPEVPRLPGTGRPLSLYDTASGTPRVLSPDVARMYVCGITPYDATHLGHAATMIAFDLVNRVWRDQGREVRYVQNVTDVDDPLLERAVRDREDWVVLGMRETALFREDMESLRVLPPAHYVGAVESIPEIVKLIGQLLDAGAAYQLGSAAGSGDIYFDVRSAPRFGYESGLDRPEMLRLFGERGGDPDRPGKRDVLDPVLWRGERAGEPAWPSPLGPGRPGWHVECAAIAIGRLGPQIDVQGGGNDLIFPHHEMSAAHAEVCTGVVPFARAYAHAGMIGLDGRKMSKSEGNLVFVSRLRADRVDSMAVRLALIADHYRTDRSWTGELFQAAARRLARWRDAARQPAGPDGEAVLARVRDRLADDLDTPGALAAVDAWADEALRGGGDDPSDTVASTVDSLLGVRLV